MKILGMIKYEKRQPSIQSEKVRVLDDITKEGEGNTFLTQQNADNSKEKLINNIDTIAKKRMSVGILQWKNYNDQDTKGFIDDVITNKKFMENVGPGSYNTHKSINVYPSYKYNPTATFSSNSMRIKEMKAIQKAQDDTLIQEIKIELSKVNMNNDKIKVKNQTPIRKDKVLKLVSKYHLSLTNVGPGKYQIQRDIGSQNQDHSINQVNDLSDRFHYRELSLKQKKENPGPGEYNLENYHQSRFEHSKFPSFGTKTQRQLKLINEDSRNHPGPGKYQSFTSQEEVIDSALKPKQYAIFQSKQKRTEVFDLPRDYSLNAHHQFYTQSNKTMLKDQILIQKKKLEKHLNSNRKPFQQYTQTQTNISELDQPEGFLSQDKRFKIDKKLIEKSNLGPGSYATDEQSFRNISNSTQGFTDNMSQLSLQSKLKQTSVFQSKVPRGLHPLNSNRDYLESLIPHTDNDKNNLADWEKKSFNMKYNKMAQRIQQSQKWMDSPQNQ